MNNIVVLKSMSILKLTQENVASKMMQNCWCRGGFTITAADEPAAADPDAVESLNLEYLEPPMSTTMQKKFQCLVKIDDTVKITLEVTEVQFLLENAAK